VRRAGESTIFLGAGGGTRPCRGTFCKGRCMGGRSGKRLPEKKSTRVGFSRHRRKRSGSLRAHSSTRAAVGLDCHQCGPFSFFFFLNWAANPKIGPRPSWEGADLLADGTIVEASCAILASRRIGPEPRQGSMGNRS